MTPSLIDYWPVLLKGVATTLWISWLGLILGGLLGALVGMAADFPITHTADIRDGFTPRSSAPFRH